MLDRERPLLLAPRGHEDAAVHVVEPGQVAELAVLLGLACRTLDVEGWGLRIAGGLPGRAGAAFGPRAAAVAASAQLLERILFAALVALIFGHYFAALPLWLFVPASLWDRYLGAQDPAGLAAVILLGFAWGRARLGYSTDVDLAVRRTWAAVGIVFVVIIWALLTALEAPGGLEAVAPIRAVEALRLMEERKITSIVVVGPGTRVEGIVHLHDLWRTQLF